MMKINISAHEAHTAFKALLKWTIQRQKDESLSFKAEQRTNILIDVADEDDRIRAIACNAFGQAMFIFNAPTSFSDSGLTADRKSIVSKCHCGISQATIQAIINRTKNAAKIARLVQAEQRLYDHFATLWSDKRRKAVRAKIDKHAMQLLVQDQLEIEFKDAFSATIRLGNVTFASATTAAFRWRNIAWPDRSDLNCQPAIMASLMRKACETFEVFGNEGFRIANGGALSPVELVSDPSGLARGLRVVIMPMRMNGSAK